MAQTKEFVIGSENTEGAQKFTPQSVTLNSVKGRIWTKRILRDGAWLHDGKAFAKAAADQAEITAAFDEVSE